MKSEYAIYKGDDLLFIGTIEECVKRFNVKRETVKWWSYPASHRRAEKGKRVKIAVKIEDEE